MSTVENGQTVSVHYVGTLDDGTEFDNSRTRGDAMSIQVGAGRVIPGFENALTGMSVGETKSFSIDADKAYGPVNPDAIQTTPRTSFPEDFELIEGLQVQGQGPNGPVLATIKRFDSNNVTLDMNHPLAGKNLNFEIELVSIS
jgi:FKBP-type peptidyl-prolyl cis-trans isomerase 2